MASKAFTQSITTQVLTTSFTRIVIIDAVASEFACSDLFRSPQFNATAALEH